MMIRNRKYLIREIFWRKVKCFCFQNEVLEFNLIEFLEETLIQDKHSLCEKYSTSNKN